MNLSAIEIDCLKNAMEEGSGSFAGTMEMITGQSVERCAIAVNVLPFTDVDGLMKLGPEPMVIISSSISGDIEGKMLYLQSRRAFEKLGEIMAPALIDGSRCNVAHRVESPMPEWLKQQRQNLPDSDEFEAQMLDAVIEIGNILFGNCMTALYHSCSVAVYRDVPESLTMADQDQLFRDLLQGQSGTQKIALLIKLDYVIATSPLNAWLLLMPGLDSIRTLLDRMHNRSRDLPAISSYA